MPGGRRGRRRETQTPRRRAMRRGQRCARHRPRTCIRSDHIEQARRRATPVVVEVLSRYPAAPPGGGRVGELLRHLLDETSAAVLEGLVRQPGAFMTVGWSAVAPRGQAGRAFGPCLDMRSFSRVALEPGQGPGLGLKLAIHRHVAAGQGDEPVPLDRDASGDGLPGRFGSERAVGVMVCGCARQGDGHVGVPMCS